MTIERIPDWPFPRDLDSIEKINEHLKKLYMALDEDSVLRIEEIEIQRQYGGNYFELDENEDIMPKAKDYTFDPLWEFDANDDIEPQA